MSKNNNEENDSKKIDKLSAAINSWTAGKCRMDSEDFINSPFNNSELIKNIILDFLKNRSEELRETIKTIENEMTPKDLFAADLFMAEQFGVGLFTQKYLGISNEDFNEMINQIKFHEEFADTNS